MFCNVDIRDEGLSEALNYTTNALKRSFSRRNSAVYLQSNTDELFRFLELLLDRGANVFVKLPDQDTSSIAALIDLTTRVPNGDFHLSRLRPYMCCPLSYSHGSRRISVDFDSSRLAPLYCLAAGRILRSGKGLKLPQQLRSFVEAHQELLRFITR